MSPRWFGFVVLLVACGGSVEATPATCEAPLHAYHFAAPVHDPGGTAATQSAECVQPGGWSHDGLSSTWCCL